MSLHENIVDTIATRCVESALTWPWIRGKMTPGKAQAFMLQHAIRNRLLSSKFRPAWMSRCDDPVVVRKTIGQMLEELVYDEQIKAPHTKILHEMGEYVGLTRQQMIDSQPTPKVDLYFNVLETLCRNRHWIVGWLSTSVDEFVLVAIKEQTNISADKWQADLGLTDEELFFFRYHEQADLEHAGKKVWEPINKHVRDDVIAADVLAGLDTSLNAAKLFYEGVSELGELLDAQGAKLRRVA